MTDNEKVEIELYMSPNILITGSNGFIAKNIINALGTKFNIFKISKTSKFRIFNFKSLSELDKIDTVIHCAARTFVPDSFEKKYSFYRFNILSTLNIAEFCLRKNVNKIIYLNAYPYGKPISLPVDENHPVEPHSPYNASKLIAEDLLFSYLNGITSVTSLRVFNVYGNFQSKHFLIPTIVNQAKKNGKIKLNDLRPKRDFLYINDLINLIDKIIESKSETGIFNVGYGKSTSIKEISEAISVLLNINVELISKNEIRPNEVLDLYSDISKVKRTFNWEPKYSIIQGLTDYLKNEK